MINQQYGASLSAEFVSLNTSSLGFFNTMKKAVYDGSCDVCVSNTTPTQARRDQVKFQVGFDDGFFVMCEIVRLWSYFSRIFENY